MGERPMVQLRGETAIIPIIGVLTRRDSWLSFFLDGRATESIALDLSGALSNPAVRRIVLDVDSPGGEVAGIHELANLIRHANTRKSVTAYVGGTGASAAYWLASAAGTIVISETALLGSIGVVSTYVDTRQRDEKAGLRRVEVVSSNAPNKRPDPTTDAGRAQVQAVVDAITNVFLTDVARFRATTMAKVQNDFGRGGMRVGADAVRAGMADGLGSLEDIIAGKPPRPAPAENPVRSNSGTRAHGDSWGTAVARFGQPTASTAVNAKETSGRRGIDSRATSSPPTNARAHAQALGSGMWDTAIAAISAKKTFTRHPATSGSGKSNNSVR